MLAVCGIVVGIADRLTGRGLKVGKEFAIAQKLNFRDGIQFTSGHIGCRGGKRHHRFRNATLVGCNNQVGYSRRRRGIDRRQNLNIVNIEIISVFLAAAMNTEIIFT